MHKGKTKREHRDFAQIAFDVVQKVTADSEGRTLQPKKDKNPAAIELGRLGGKARAKKLSPVQRRRIAKKAAKGRWGKKR